MSKNNKFWLYHATSKENLDSIMRDGLLVDPPNHNWAEMYTDDQIFLAFDANTAKAYVEECKNPPKEIVVLKINMADLTESNFNYDWNNRCEYINDINSVAYEDDIPSDVIEIVEDLNKEPIQNIHSFRKTYMYEVIMDTFNYEVETNKDKTIERD